MEIKNIVDSKKEIVDDIICDCCGNSCLVDKGVIDNPIRLDYGETSKTFEFMEMSTHWGYFSNKDTEKWTAQICEKCIDEKFQFVKFKKSNYF